MFSGINLADGQSAWQSTTLGSAVAGKAVDGNTDSSYSHGGCTHTSASGQANPIWAVDLGDNYLIHRVVIYNRADNVGQFSYTCQYISCYFYVNNYTVRFCCVIMQQRESFKQRIYSYNESILKHIKHIKTNIILKIR